MTEWYLGIDLTRQSVQISCYNDEMDEPETISQIANTQKYQIPVCLCKKKGVGQWYFGEEAKQAAYSTDAILIEDIYTPALQKDKIYADGESLDAVALFGLFLQKAIAMISEKYQMQEIAKITFTVRESSQQVIELIDAMDSYLPVEKQHISLQDYKESFYYYALSAKQELYTHDVVLFDYDENHTMSWMYLEINHTTQPKVVVVKQQIEEKFGISALGFRKKDEDKDQLFCQLAEEIFQGKIISCVYLIGDGFDGEWMKESTKYLCRGRRVFLGKNLYTKGACFSAKQQKNPEWPFVFLGESKTRANVCLFVLSSGKNQLITLVSAGENWYETSGQEEVILENDNVLKLILKAPDHSATKEESLVLNGLPERENRTTRLLIEARPESEQMIKIRIKDLGFGEFFPSSKLVWEYRITI